MHNQGSLSSIGEHLTRPMWTAPQKECYEREHILLYDEHPME